MNYFYVLYNDTHIHINNSLDMSLELMIEKGYSLYAYTDNKDEALYLATELNAS